MTTALLSDAFAHHIWATERLIDECAALTPEHPSALDSRRCPMTPCQAAHSVTCHLSAGRPARHNHACATCHTPVPALSRLRNRRVIFSVRGTLVASVSVSVIRVLDPRLRMAATGALCSSS
jgi:hypothetical protein